MSVLFVGNAAGDLLDAATYSANWDLLENSFLDRGAYIVSGLTPSIGTGLAVSVSAGTASIGGRVSAAGSFNITGLSPSTTVHLFLLQNGSGSSNTTGTPPANSVKLGTAVTGVSTVTSVNVLRSSGRQALVRPESQVNGAVGSPGSIDLSSWAASAADGIQVFGTLPAGAVPSTTLSGDVTGALASNTVTKIRGRAIVQPGSTEDSWVPRYSNSGTNLVWSKASSIATLGVWGASDISALGTSDAEVPNAWTVGSTNHGVQIPDSGTLEWLSILLPSDIGGAGVAVTGTVFKNGVATALTTGINGGAGTETKVLAGTTVTVNQADIITVQAHRTGAPNAVVATFVVYWSCRI